MIRQPRDPLPDLYHASVDTFTIERRPGSDGYVQLVGGGQTQIPESGITVDKTDSGDNGVNTGSTWNSSEVHYVYLYESGGTAVATIDNTGPISGAPSGISNYRYIGSVRSQSSGNIHEFHQVNGHYNIIGLPLQVYNGDGSNPTASTWDDVVDLVSSHYIPETATAVEFRGANDSDLGQTFDSYIASHYGTPTYTPSPVSTVAFNKFQYASNQGMKLQARWLPITDGKIWMYTKTITSTADEFTYSIQGFIDGHIYR